MDFHRLSLRVALMLAAIALVANAWRVIGGNAWLFAPYVK